MTPDAKEILKKYWGYDTFRSPQEEIIRSIISGRDTFAMLPTGGGKSLTFQIPALMLEGVCLVISPLIALMKDQLQNLLDRKIKAAFISSELTRTDIQIILDNCRFGGTKLLYISPERLQSAGFLASLETLNVSFIAIDEAHCISEWGHDFRPAYLELKKIKELFPEKPILALTATATPYIQDEIIKELHLEDPGIFKKSLERKNLAYRIVETEDKLSALTDLLRRFRGSSIVFCNTRKETYETAKFLQEQKLDADFFHARLNPEDKNRKQQDFINSDSQILVSTNAFGMGIDKPDIRNVFHLSPPQSIESYFQEVGRAGRDGEAANGFLLYNPKEDRKNALKAFRYALPKKDQFLEIIRNLYNYYQIGEFEKPEGQKAFSERDFREKYGFAKSRVKSVLNFLVQQKTIDIQRSQHQSLVKILIENRNFQDDNHMKGRVLSYLARNYAGIFHEPKPVDEFQIARNLKLSAITVKEKLKELNENDTVFYRDASIIKISFTEARDDNYARVTLYKKFESLQRIKWQRLNAMYFYADNESRCKSRLLLQYFGEKSPQNCGVCSWCRPFFNEAKPAAADILLYLKEGEKNNDALLERFRAFDRLKVLEQLQFLLDEEKIKFKLPNTYYI